MVIQAGPVHTAVPGQHPVAGAQLVKLIYQLYRILYRSSRGKGAEIAGFVLFHLSGKQDSWIFFPRCHFNIRIGFIILEHRIVAGAVLFNQVIFQHQRFQLRIGDDILKPGYFRYHLFYFRAFVRALPEIGTHPVPQTDCLPHINNGILFVMHNIYAGLGRKLL